MKHLLVPVATAAVLAVPATASAASNQVRIDVKAITCEGATVTIGQGQSVDPTLRIQVRVDGQVLPGFPQTVAFTETVRDFPVAFQIPDGAHSVQVSGRIEPNADGRWGYGQEVQAVTCTTPKPPVTPPVSTPPAPPAVVPPPPVTPPPPCVPASISIHGPRVTPMPHDTMNVWTVTGATAGVWRLDGQVRGHGLRLRLRSVMVGRMRHGRIVPGSRYGRHVLTFTAANGCGAKVTVVRVVFNKDPVRR